MARLTGNRQLCDATGRPLFTLGAVNRLPVREKEGIYARLLPQRLLDLLGIAGSVASHPLLTVIAPEGLSFARIEVRRAPEDTDTVFFLELSDTPYRQMELSFCIIADPAAPRFNVDRHLTTGDSNYFTSLGRNIPEEIRAMKAGLFPNQTRRGLRLFVDFFPLLERFADALGMDMILGEPLTYDNAIRYERYGFDYITGKRLMQAIDVGFGPGGAYRRRLDGSSPFRMPGQEQTIFGRSWAIHDGILDEPWDGVRIYKMIGVHARINTFQSGKSEGS
jgi:hypothetical protein